MNLQVVLCRSLIPILMTQSMSIKVIATPNKIMPKLLYSGHPLYSQDCHLSDQD